MHSNRKPFVCPFPGCTKAYRQAGKLSIHKKKHIKLAMAEPSPVQENPTHTIQERGGICQTAELAKPGFFQPCERATEEE